MHARVFPSDAFAVRVESEDNVGSVLPFVDKAFEGCPARQEHARMEGNEIVRDVFTRIMYRNIDCPTKRLQGNVACFHKSNGASQAVLRVRFQLQKPCLHVQLHIALSRTRAFTLYTCLTTSKYLRFGTGALPSCGGAQEVHAEWMHAARRDRSCVPRRSSIFSRTSGSLKQVDTCVRLRGDLRPIKRGTSESVYSILNRGSTSSGMSLCV